MERASTVIHAECTEGKEIAERLKTPIKVGKCLMHYCADKPVMGRFARESNRKSRMRENLVYGIDEGLWETCL